MANEKLIDYITNTVKKTPFYQLLGIRLESLGEGEAVLSLQTSKEHTNPAGLIHGGIIMALADAAMGNAIRSLGVMGVTADCSTAFPASAPLGAIIEARGKVLKQGKNLIFAEALVYAEGRLVGHCKATFFNTGLIEL